MWLALSGYTKVEEWAAGANASSPLWLCATVNQSCSLCVQRCDCFTTKGVGRTRLGSHQPSESAGGYTLHCQSCPVWLQGFSSQYGPWVKVTGLDLQPLVSLLHAARTQVHWEGSGAERWNKATSGLPHQPGVLSPLSVVWIWYHTVLIWDSYRSFFIVRLCQVNRLYVQCGTM